MPNRFAMHLSSYSRIILASLQTKAKFVTENFETNDFLELTFELATIEHY